jgi:hypothetical protein
MRSWMIIIATALLLGCSDRVKVSTNQPDGRSGTSGPYGTSEGTGTGMEGGVSEGWSGTELSEEESYYRQFKDTAVYKRDSLYREKLERDSIK